MNEKRVENFEILTTPCAICEETGRVIRKNKAASRLFRKSVSSSGILSLIDRKDISRYAISDGFAGSRLPLFLSLAHGEKNSRSPLGTAFADGITYCRRNAVMLLCPDIFRNDFASILFPDGVPRDMSAEALGVFLENTVACSAAGTKSRYVKGSPRVEYMLDAFLRISAMVISDLSEDILTDAPMRSDVIADIIGYACFKILSGTGISVAFSNRLPRTDCELVNFRLFSVLAINHIMLHPAVRLGIPLRVRAESDRESTTISAESDISENLLPCGKCTDLERLCRIMPERTIEYVFFDRAVKGRGCALSCSVSENGAGAKLTSSVSVPVLVPGRLKAGEEKTINLEYIKSRIDRYAENAPALREQNIPDRH